MTLSSFGDTPKVSGRIRFHVACGALALAALLLAPGTRSVAHAMSEANPDAAMLRFPDIGPNGIVFSYANDLWVVGRDGGVALPLASPPGAELFPKWNSDGTSIAFVGNYDGNQDLYVIPAAGGVPTRVTHHPASEVLSDFTADNRLVFATSGLAGLGRQQQLFSVPASGGLPTRLPVPYGASGAISPDGTWLAYTPHTTDFRTWKRYRGGMATDIWLFNLRDNSARRMTDWEGTDTTPMWVGSVIYYLSDDGPQHRQNIWRFDPATSERTQITNFDDFDIKWPSAGPGPSGGGEIVFQHGSALRVLDIPTGSVRQVKVAIPGDRPRLRTRTVDAARMAREWSVSPSAKRAAVSARGDIWTAPAEHGSPRNLTRTSGAYERSPAWSPDGRWIAYLSDASGEYEFHLVQSDGKEEPRRITFDGAVFRYGATWSPDSRHFVFTDKTGSMWLFTLGEGESQGTMKLVDKDPLVSGGSSPSWTQDSRWLAYQRANELSQLSHIRIYSVESGETRQVTSGVFSDQNPVFDRKGEWLYFSSNRAWESPSYADLDQSFIYAGTEVLLAVPLRKDIASPFNPKSDEESWKDAKKEDGEKSDDKKKDENGEKKEGDESPSDADDVKPADKPTPKPGEKSQEKSDKGEATVEDDGISGTWDLSIFGVPEAQGPLNSTATITRGPGGKLGGSISSPMGDAQITDGSFDRATGALSITFVTPEGSSGTITATVTGEAMKGSFTLGTGVAGEISGTRTAKAAPATAEAEGDAGKEEKGKKKEVKPVIIDFDRFENRAILLPLRRGTIGQLGVNEGGSLLFVRRGSRGADEGPAAIKIFDPSDDKREEKQVTTGGGFDLTADGKKLLVGTSIFPASAAASGKPLVTAGMNVAIEPRAEWAQIFDDSWRIMRDFFYEPTMHGVDWKAVGDRYRATLADCSSREDVAYVISEMISELNVGHAYYRPGESEGGPSVGVALLGADFELVNEGGVSAYRISAIHEGAPWDADARGPLSQPGIDVKVGDFLLAVNGVPVDSSKDPWAAFVGLGERPVTLTVSATPTIDDEARDVIVTTVGSEGSLRFRAWIEAKRRYVEEKTNGQVGYIYVPDTGVNGQNELFRQFFGQLRKPALIIDERWNGGGQIPTRFIELLNRPLTNSWARRDGEDWRWPPDSHQGPKCMLINGLAGSGGDAFPHYFKQAKLGKLIGTRTWGGLVGISGNPGLVDGAALNVPTFGFYDNDGTWGIEGHGVDPDIEVIDDPSKMVSGGDPQLDAAIELMLGELRDNPFEWPTRPASPNRSGMGIPDSDR